MVPLITPAHTDACAALRARVKEDCHRDLSKVFAAWLPHESEYSAELVSIAAKAATRESADLDFQTIALLGFSADAGVLSDSQIVTLKKGLSKLAGRSAVVNGVLMPYCADAVGILGVAVGSRATADADIINKIAKWIATFLKVSYEMERCQDWQRALFACADVTLGSPLRLATPTTADIADVRTALRAKGIFESSNGKYAKEDAARTFSLAIQEIPGDPDCDRITLRLAALERVVRAAQKDASTPGFDDRTLKRMFVLDAPTPATDRVLQTDPVWTIRGTQKTPIPLTRLSGEIVWINPLGSKEPEDSVLTAEEEQQIAEVTLSARTELRSEIETVFGGPDWPAASAIIEPFRCYAIKVFDVNAKICRRAASAHGRDFNEVLGAMARNLLSEMFGIEWDKSPGDKVIRIDWQCGTEGWTGKEIRVIAGNNPDPVCRYHELIGDAIKYRYRFHDVPPDPIPGEPPGINLSNAEWWDYIGLKERHNLAMAIKPYLEDREAHWQSICASRRPTDASNGTEGQLQTAPGPSESLPEGGVPSRPQRKRGRPTEIPDERKQRALAARGGKARAQILYATKYPSPQQVKNVSSILKHYRRKGTPKQG